MKTFTIVLILLIAALPAAAFDLGNRAPDKPAVANTPPAVDPDVVRQGGETIADAVAIAIPTVDLTGTTAGYYDDYDEVCPYTYSASPDVVYGIVPDADMSVDIDMLGSSYDTKIYVYDADLSVLACNDDFHSDYTSKIERLPLLGGAQYYLVIDGYGGDWGDYLLNISEYVPCELECPAFSVEEGEPPLTVDYVDDWNGGCNTDPVNGPFQPIAQGIFCGVSGWFSFQGGNSRDTDWFLITIPSDGAQTIVGDAEFPCFMFELGPQDCNSVAVIQNVSIGPCAEATMVITGAPGSEVWFWVGPQTFSTPDGSDVYEFDYVLDVVPTGLAVQEHTLSGVKSLFR